ncbi:MAG: hypothetical protein ABSF34_02395 [Verrucomicrobiota bacterium]
MAVSLWLFPSRKLTFETALCHAIKLVEEQPMLAGGRMRAPTSRTLEQAGLESHKMVY